MNRFYTIIMTMLFLTNISFAKTGTSNVSNLELIKIVNQQQILSQRITKAYLYVGKNINVDSANKQLQSALSSFYKTYSKINTSTKSPEIRKLMAFIKKSSSEFKKLSRQPLNSKNTKSMLTLSEKVLKKSKAVASLLKKSLKSKAYQYVTKSSEQEMLAERIAKYYIALKSNSKNQSMRQKMKLSIDQFSKNHKKLMQNHENSKAIKNKLKEVDKLWKLVNKFYNDEKLPKIVFSSTNDISKKMKEVRKLYVAQAK